MSSRGPALSAAQGTPAGSTAGAPAASPAGTATASPWVDLDRAAWSRLAAATPLPLDGADVERLRGLGERIDLAEVEQVYLPLSRLLNLHAAGVQRLHAVTSTFLDPAAVQPVARPQGVVAGRAPHGAPASAPGVRAAAVRTPFVIAVAGSVAVGKSTTARLLRELLSRWPETPRVELVTTDGFLLPNAELERRGLLERKGFPESYDQRALLRFVTAVKSGAAEVRAPLYSHLSYDIVPGAEIVVRLPDVLIVEGLNVLQPARTHADGVQGLAVSDFFDVSVYVDARTEDIRRWYVDRFLRLRETAFARPESYFRRYADLSDAQAAERAAAIWARTNEPNLLENVLPTRGRATIVLRKGADHAVTRVRLRKL